MKRDSTCGEGEGLRGWGGGSGTGGASPEPLFGEHGLEGRGRGGTHRG